MAILPDASDEAAEVKHEQRRRLEELTVRMMERMSDAMLRAHRRGTRPLPPAARHAGGAFQALSDGAVDLLLATCAPPSRRRV